MRAWMVISDWTRLQAHVSGDVDGIFGGSPQTYARDLQFKALTTTIMVRSCASGWVCARAGSCAGSGCYTRLNSDAKTTTSNANALR